MASKSTPIFIFGAAGTGKKTFARHIHTLSEDRHEKLVEIESREWEKTAPDHFNLYPNAFYIFNNCEELTEDAQRFLMRVIEEKSLEIEGERIAFTGRLLFISSLNPSEILESQKLRHEFFLRVSIFQIHLPDLTDRQEDFAPLTAALFETLKKRKISWREKTLSPEVMPFLAKQKWVANLEELKTCLRLALVRSGERELLTLSDFSSLAEVQVRTPLSVALYISDDAGLSSLKVARDEFEQVFIQKALRKTRGNKTQAAKLLGLSREGLRKALNKKAA